MAVPGKFSTQFLGVPPQGLFQGPLLAFQLEDLLFDVGDFSIIHETGTAQA